MSDLSESKPPIDMQGLIAALKAMQPSIKDERRRAFHDAFPAIEEKLNANFTHQQIVDILKVHGVDLTLPTFRKWKKEEEERRNIQAQSSGPSNQFQQAMRKQADRRLD